MKRAFDGPSKLSCSTLGASAKKVKEDEGEPFVYVLGELLLHDARGKIHVYRLMNELPCYTFQETLLPQARPPPYGVFEVHKAVAENRADHQRRREEKSRE